MVAVARAGQIAYASHGYAAPALAHGYAAAPAVHGYAAAAPVAYAHAPVAYAPGREYSFNQD